MFSSYIKNNPGDIAELGSALANQCIANYVKPIIESDVINEICVSFNKDNAKGSRAFYRDYPFVMDRHHIAIISNSSYVNAKYLHRFLDQFLITKKYGWGDNVASVEEIKRYALLTPQPNEKYTSLAIQDAIVQFIEYFENRNFEQIKIINQALDNIQQIEDVFFSLFFEKDHSIALRFDKFCKLKNIDLKFDDIEFETKRILSDNANELVCTKRMGFTPKRSKDGNIFWYTVGDLTANKSIFITEPATKEKTTIELIRESISANSSKYIPIKKGDILVSFKLTVGTTKIYDSDYAAYCNEAIDILTPNSDINHQYLAYNCYYEYPKYGSRTNNGTTLNDDDKRLISIKIPKSTETFNSKVIQDILVDFIEEYLSKLATIKSEMDELQSMFSNYNQILIHKAFN